jgi:hypothetical protein
MRTSMVALGILALSMGGGATAAQRASQDALGSPEGTGLVIVEVGFERARTARLFGGGGDDVRGYLQWLGDTPRVIEAAESKDLLVFSGLPPGPYRLAGISATMKSGNVSWPLQAQMPPDDAHYSVDVKAGTPVYLGKVTVADQQRLFSVGRAAPPTATIEHNPKLAGEAWKRFLSAHGKTAWAARVREHLAGGGATAAPAPATAAAPARTPIERLEALAREADAALQNGTVRNFLEQRQSAIDSAESDLSAHLQTNPDDARAMLLGVRIAWMRESNTPVALDLVAGRDVTAPDGAFVALAAKADRVIALQPNNAAAHFWKARIAAIELPSVKNGVFAKAARDLPQAVASARRAVELEPESVLYRDALATFLVMDGKSSEALEVVRVVTGAGGAPHPITSILAAWQALPLPENMREQQMLARGLTDEQVDRGRITNYPGMRIRAYAVPTRMTDVEAFYKTRVKNFKLFELASEREGPTRMTLFAQFLTWKDGRLEPATSKRQVEEAPDRAENGVALIFAEFVDVPEGQGRRPDGITSGTFSQLTFMNLVSMRGR